MSVVKTITERIGVHKTAVIFLEELKWLEREQPISDYGIDMHIEIVENGIPNGLLFALQIKTGSSYLNNASTNHSIVYYGETRHLDYWTNHSLPVILVIYDDVNNIAYWEFVNEKTIKLTEKGWRIEIPKTKILSKNSIEDLKKYYYDPNNYLILSTEDTSHALSRRVSAKILVKNKPTKSTVMEFIPVIINKMKKDDYYRNQQVEQKYKGKPADCVWIYFYNNIIQYKNGFPFCIAEWNNPTSKSPTMLTSYKDEIEDIHIQWKYGDLIADSFLQENRLDKGPYLKIIDNFVISTRTIISDIQNIYNIFLDKKLDFGLLTEQILGIENKFNSLLPEEYHKNYPPYECNDLSQVLLNLEAYIGNIFIVLKSESDEQNKIYQLKLYLKDSMNTLVKIEYERGKIN